MNAVITKQQAITLTESNSEAFITSALIAKQLRKSHKAILQLIDRYKEDFEKLYPLAFQMVKGCRLKQGGFAKSTRVALLNEEHCYLLLTYVRNNEHIRELKVLLFQSFARYRQTQQLAATYKPSYTGLLKAINALAAVAYPDNVYGVTFLSMQYNGLINKVCNIEPGTRHALTALQRGKLAMVTMLVAGRIENGVLSGMDCRDIFTDTKETLANIDTEDALILTYDEVAA